MISYYERYLDGEHAAVWEELSQLGAAVYTAPLHADAQDKLAALEAAGGRLPLSLHAWYEHMESACFVGTFVGTVADPPVEATTGTLAESGETGESESDGLLSQEPRTSSPRAAEAPALLRALAPEVVQFIRAHSDRVDPFWWDWQLPSWHELLHHRTPGMALDIPFSPDAPVKGGKPGGIAYSFTASTPSMDGWVESERSRQRFVPYLRHCLLEWGGFPGIGEYTDLPASIMAPLTAGLPAF